MDKIIEYLKQLELSDIEAKLYLTLLKTGPLSVRDLAETIEIKRTTAYLYIDQLIEKGLIMKMVKGANKLVAANEPEETLQHLVEVKLQKAKNLEISFPSMIETIHTSLPQIKDVGDAEIKYYKGKNGVMKIYEEALKAKELRSYVNFEILRNALPENESLFPNELKKNKTIQIFEILEDSPTSRKILGEFHEANEHNDRFFHKFLPHNVKLSAVDILIYDGKVAIINVKKQLTGILLQNVEYYNNSKELFDLMWKILP